MAPPAGKQSKGRARRRVKKNIAIGQAHIKTSFNNTIVSLTDKDGNVIAWESAGSAGLQGLAQVDAVRRPGDRRLLRPQGHGARPPEGRGLRQGPRLRAARPRSARSRPPASRSSASRTSPRRPTTACARRSGGGSSGPPARPQVQALPPRGHEALPQGRALPDGEVRRRAPQLPAGRARARPHQAVGVPAPAAREAEGAPLLRPAREAVPQLLREGREALGDHGRGAAAHARDRASTTSSTASASPPRARRRASSSATATSR